MNKLACIIVDDEPLALDILEEYVRRTPSLELAGRFTSSADALEALRGSGDKIGDKAGDGDIDLAFLDIQMPGPGGLDVARALDAAGGRTRVVFTTAFPQFALEGFRVDALDYLLKPISFEEFSQAVARAVAWFGRGGDDEPALRTVNPSEVPAGQQTPQTLIVKSDYKQFVIPLADIAYIEGIRDYIRIGLDGGETIRTLMNLKAVEDLLPASGFARIHRSWIVSLGRVRRIERAHVVISAPRDDGAEMTIPISDTYKESFARALAARAL